MSSLTLAALTLLPPRGPPLATHTGRPQERLHECLDARPMSGPTYNMPLEYRFNAHTRNGWCANRRARVGEQRVERNGFCYPNLSQKAQEMAGQTIVERAPLVDSARALEPNQRLDWIQLLFTAEKLTSSQLISWIQVDFIRLSLRLRKLQ